MTESILTINAGSSSVKFAQYAISAGALGEKRLRGEISGIGGRARLDVYGRNGESLTPEPATSDAMSSRTHALDAMFEWLARNAAGTSIVAVGHRIVHGGAKYFDPVRIDADVLIDLEALVPIARLHQPFELDAVHALRARDPTLCQVACFDTAFHRTQPDVAQRYPLPRSVTQSGIRRYGFHGLSYAYVAGELSRELPGFETARVIVAHLGSGASLCAIRGGLSVATTMGFTVLEGLMMGTRAGSIDPGIVLYLLQERGMTAEQVSHMLYHESGLRGVSGLTADMQALLASDVRHAQEAVELYVYSVVKEIGAMAACLEGVDALVFTAGIGERAAAIRARVCDRLAWMGIVLDEHANDAHARRIDAAGSRIGVWVIPSDEESMIARGALRVALSSP